MSDETRSKISAAQKLRYKHDPALKAAMRLKLVVRAASTSATRVGQLKLHADRISTSAHARRLTGLECCVSQGKEPWNKGGTMSVETRAKMAAAKSGLSLRKGVRAKMSRAHAGKTHTEVCNGHSNTRDALVLG